MNEPDPIKELDKLAKQVIASDSELIRFLTPYLVKNTTAVDFIKISLKKIETRRMLLRVQWYVELAELIKTARDGRPALPLIFLMAMAESIARQQHTARVSRSLGSFDAITQFFDHIEAEDKLRLRRSIRRALLGYKISTLRFESVLKILWNVRNDAVHGTNFWNFNLPDMKTTGKLIPLMTSGRLGTRKRPKRESLTVNIQYHDLQAIFIKTAINNIKNKFS